MKHTPGPWKAIPLSGRDGISHAVISEHPEIGYFHVAECSTHDGRDYAEANAQLISAAPELLGALENLFKHCSMIHKYWGEGSNQREADEAINHARAALNKARGATVTGGSTHD